MIKQFFSLRAKKFELGFRLGLHYDVSASQRSAFALLELIAMVAMLLILIAVLAPAMGRNGRQKRQFTKRAQCVENLKNIGLAFRLSTLPSGDLFPMKIPTKNGGTMEYLSLPGSTFRHFAVLSNEIEKAERLVCPSDRRPQARRFDQLTDANISYFVGVDAEQTCPNVWLAGDRNLLTNGFQFTNGLMVLQTNRLAGWDKRIHKSCGNICMGDGSVQQFNNADLQRSMSEALRSYNEPQRLSVPW
jgi:type II secretory pathway pseudopilin PulG